MKHLKSLTAVMITGFAATSTHALTVTLDADNREVYAGSYWTVGPDSPGADFDFSQYAAYQTSTTPQRVDANTFAFGGEGAGTYDYDCYFTCEGSFIGSRYSIDFTVDEDSYLDLDITMTSDGIPLRIFGVRVQGLTGHDVLDYTTGFNVSDSASFSDTLELLAGNSYRFYFNYAPYLDDLGERQGGEIYWNMDATITTVPIPAAGWLFLSALAGAGWLRRPAKSAA